MPRQSMIAGAEDARGGSSMAATQGTRISTLATKLEDTKGWLVCAMKERTYSRERVPVYFPARLRRNEDPRIGSDLLKKLE